MKSIAIVLTVMCAVFGTPSAAQSDVDLAQVVELWLSGDDEASLPHLAHLARTGDSGARLLLARIETGDLGPSPYRLSLTSDERRRLFRRVTPGSRFGTSWLMIEAQAGNALASALLSANRPGASLARIAALHDIGELQAGHHATQILALYGTASDRADLLESGLILPELAPYVAYLSGPPEPRGNGLAALRHITGSDADPADQDTRDIAELLALGHGFGDDSADNRWRGAVQSWLMSSPHTAPIARLCTSACGASEAPACAFALLSVTGGYYEVIRLDTPLQSIISQEAFLASRRAELMALRRAVLVRRETNLGWVAEWDEIAPISSCAARLILEEREAYLSPPDD